jgi:hypothetical protein
MQECSFDSDLGHVVGRKVFWQWNPYFVWDIEQVIRGGSVTIRFLILSFQRLSYLSAGLKR